MSSEKENAQSIINFDNPAVVGYRVPMHLISYLGCNHEGYTQSTDHLVDHENTWEDIWGTIWKLKNGFISEMPIGHPLAGGQEYLQTFQWPDSNDERIIGKIFADFEKNNDQADFFLTGFHRDLLWEKSCMLSGMQNVMIWFKTDPGLVREIFHRIMDFQLGIANHYLKCGVEIAKFGDDLGGQSNSLFSHEIFKEFVLPEYQRIFELYKRNNILVYFHSCGNIERFIDDFIELGVNVLNPVQATANNLDHIREKTNRKITIEGCVNSRIVMHGTPDDVATEVKHRIRQMGKNGGFFCCPDQKMPYPQENISSLLDALERYGKYPIEY